MKLIYRLLTSFPTRYRFLVWAITAFISVISFFQINSNWADHHHANWMWWSLGLVFGIFSAGVFILGVIESHNYNK